jgi:GT2 family glycosyltransferase
MSFSVCIATHERPGLLAPTLEALGGQVRSPDEILISDSSRGADCGPIVEAFRAEHPAIPVRWLRTPCRALPWLRFAAALRAGGDVVLFLDDDVVLESEALAVLEHAYTGLRVSVDHAVAGVGFRMTWQDGSSPSRDRGALRERWLGTACAPSGSVTPGGLTVSLADLKSERPVAVDHLWGGAMSYRREVLEDVGLLDALVILYQQGIGRGEDAVLSRYARAYGGLYLLTVATARHRKAPHDEPTPYAATGWRLGMTATWGRAHTLRWLARDQTAYRAAWARLASLELARSLQRIALRPWSPSRWGRLCGATVGITRALHGWRRISYSARSGGAPIWPVEEMADPCVRDSGAP